jgi:hypothetical protein
MARLGFGDHFILLVKSLFANATSRVFVNGMFTLEILLHQGVRQGYLLSPLIYAIATQLLMDTFDSELENKRMWDCRSPPI